MNFDGTSRWYDTLALVASFGAIQRCQIDNLLKQPPKGNVLIIGGGTGWILPQMIGVGSIDQIDYVEASREMIDKARGNVPPSIASRIRFVFGDENDIPEERYDSIFTNFFLDCFELERLKSVMSLLAKKLKSNGYWYCSEFHINHDTLHQYWQKPLVSIMIYLFQRTARLEASRLHNFSIEFKNLGFQLGSRQSYLGGFIQNHIYSKG